MSVICNCVDKSSKRETINCRICLSTLASICIKLNGNRISLEISDDMKDESVV